MTDLQRLCAELAGMAKRTERHADVFEAFALESESASGGVDSGVGGPLAGSHSCARCGDATHTQVCDPCDVALELHRDRLQMLARPYCGECGDTGLEPVEVELGYVRLPRWQDEPQPCERCPRCDECGVELRLHPRDTMECP